MAFIRRPLDTLGSAFSPDQAMPTGAGGLGGMDTAPTGTEGMSDLDLASLVGGEDPTMDMGMQEEDPEGAQMEAALADPNTPPEIRAMLEQQLAMAARRGLAGL